MKKILIIEDDQIVADIYRKKLSVEGFRVEVALDGESGMAIVKDFQPDAVLLDLMLPKTSGIEVMRQLRSDEKFGQSPIIVFSNTYLTNMMQEAREAGATKCLSKASCSPKHVIEALRTALGISGSGAPLTQATSTGSSPATRPTATPAAVVLGKPQPVPVERPASSGNDAEFQAELRRDFIQTLPPTLNALRGAVKSLIKADNEMARLGAVQELYRRVHALTGNAGIAGMMMIAQMADAAEALLKELYEKPKNINASTMRTVANAVDFIGVLFERGTLPDRREVPSASILVVDDESISRRAVTYALEKAKLKSVAVEDPNQAFKMIMENRFDLIFLDVDMPGMNGFELCAKLRALPAHKHTPVVFVTSLNDFESRANSTISGGNDFIAKPFLFIELAVKALVYVLKGKLSAAK